MAMNSMVLASSTPLIMGDRPMFMNFSVQAGSRV